MEITRYALYTAKMKSPIKVALASDLHDRHAKPTLEALACEKPDLILMPGDIFDTQPLPGEKPQRDSIEFLNGCSKLAPSYLSIGNHEWEAEDNLRKIVAETGVKLLDDEAERMIVNGNQLVIGGLTSPCGRVGSYSRFYTPDPDVAFLDELSNMEGYKILLSHHPEFYPRLIAQREIDLTLAGHAHGGQIRFMDRGLFAPGQGFFPKLTSGVHQGRLVISRGLGNHTPIPRIWNPFELIIITIFPKA